MNEQDVDEIERGMRAGGEWPDDDQLVDWMADGYAEATDGCAVELDGMCEHGHRSWLLVLGMI